MAIVNRGCLSEECYRDALYVSDGIWLGRATEHQLREGAMFCAVIMTELPAMARAELARREALEA